MLVLSNTIREEEEQVTGRMSKEESRRIKLATRARVRVRTANRRMLPVIILNLLSARYLLSSLVLINYLIGINIKFGHCVSSIYHSSIINSNPTSLIQAHNQHQFIHRCSNGAPLQWRPYLDVASKAHLAPNVVLGSLQQLNLSPIQLTPSGQQQSGSLFIPLSQQQRQQQLVYHPQNINNIGVNIEATFIVTKILKRSLPNLRVTQTVKLVYKVSASLSTTQALMTLVNSSGSMMNSSDSSNALQNQAFYYQNQRLLQQRSQQQQQQQQHHHHQQQQQLQQATTCSLELSELELVKKANKIFKINQNYVLFLDQSGLSSQHHSQHPAEIKRAFSDINSRSNHQFQQLNLKEQKEQVGAAGSSSYLYSPFDSASLHPFATHELLTNQTSRALRKILCKNCAQVPQIQLLNSTLVQEQQQSQTTPNKIKLDCRVTGYPTPWIQWFRNGKLLRNKSGKLNIRTNRWKKRYNVRLSRLEIIQQVGKNDTGVYECRAMNVVAREPVVGAYTLLVLPTNYAIIPMQPSLVASISSDTSGSGSSNGNSIDNSNFKYLANETTTTIEISSKVKEVNRPKSNTSPPTASVTSTTPTTVAPTIGGGGGSSNNSSISGSTGNKTKGTSSADPSGASTTIGNAGAGAGAGQVPCPREVHDIYCLNKGTCVLIGNIAEFYCNCAEGYHGHRCEYKSSKPQKPVH